jgi:hypothetical protein
VIAHPLFVWAVEWPMLWLRVAELFRTNKLLAGDTTPVLMFPNYFAKEMHR